MRKIEVNGKVITTNYGESGADTIVRGDNLPNYRMEVKNSCMESDKEFLERLVSYGYTRIRFACVSTRVRGIHSTFAYCR